MVGCHHCDHFPSTTCIASSGTIMEEASSSVPTCFFFLLFLGHYLECVVSSPMVLLFSSIGLPRAMAVAYIAKEASGSILPIAYGQISCTWHLDFFESHDFWEQP